MAQLVLRATPIDSHLPSPAELLYGRRVVSNLPVATSNATGSRCAIRTRLDERQASAKEHHDARGVTDLPVLSRHAHATRTPIDGSLPVLLTLVSNRVPMTSNRLAEESCDVIDETSAKQQNNTCCCTLMTTTLGAMGNPNVLGKVRPTLLSTNETHSARQQFIMWSQLAPALVESSVLHHDATCDT